ncbi:pentapeptide repeat-containing protein [Streptomyces xanthophaeus]|uniref:pentapeptide repeat-containing protein n=1 Tax=Streptomyces xanthophaeus TaxID=67385 RepID=UPI0039902FA8
MSAVAVAGFTWTSITQVNSEQAITREGQITDRYTAAVENLGNKDSEDVRLGGIYALQRIMQDSPRDQPTVINVLTSFIRSQSAKQKQNRSETASDIAAAATVLTSRNPQLDGRITVSGEIEVSLDLRDADLQGIGLQGAQLAHANLSGANLTRTNLASADLTRAHLSDVDLTKANLDSADLTRAYLSDVDLRKTYLVRADLTCADLVGANLQYDLEPYGWGAITSAQALSAHIGSNTKLPKSVAEDPDVQKHIKTGIDFDTCPK